MDEGRDKRMKGERGVRETNERKKGYFIGVNDSKREQRALPASIDGSCVIRAVVFNVQTALLRTKERASIIGSAACGVFVG